MSLSLANLTIASRAFTAVSGNTYVGTPFSLSASFAASNDGPPIFTTIIGLSYFSFSSSIASAIPSGSADAVGHTITIKLSTSSYPKTSSRDSLYLLTGASPNTSIGFFALPSSVTHFLSFAVVSSSN